MARPLASAWVSVSPSGFAQFAKKASAGVKTALRGVSAQVPVTANTTPALTGLDKLKARLAELSRRVTDAGVGLDDKQARAALAKMDVQLDRLSRRVASPRITLEGTKAALADVLAVDAALDRLNDKQAKGGAGGKASRIALPSLAGAAGVTGLAGVAAGGLGVLPAIAAAGLGVASFGALALPTIKRISDAMTQVTADTNTYDRATTKAGRNTALIHIREDWAKLTPAQRDAVKGIQGLQAGFGKLSAALAPLTLKVLNDGLRIANGLLPDLAPFARAAGNALDGLLKSAGKFTQTAGFKGFIADLTRLSGPAITTIGEAVGQITVAVGKLLRALASPGGMAVFAGAAAGLATAITAVASGFAFLNKHVSPAVLHDAGTAILAVYGAVKLWGIAQAALDALLAANPIGLVVVAVAALAAGFTIAWKNSATFRDVIKSLAGVMLGVGIVILKVNKAIVDSFLSVIGTILHGLADAFGWIPGGVGSALKSASRHFDNFKAGTDNVINGLIRNMQGWQKELNASKQTVAQASASIVKNFQSQGDAARKSRIDLATYTDAVRKNRADTDAGRSARAKLINDLIGSGVNARTANRLVDNLQGAINRMHGKTVSVGVHGSGSGGVQITPSSGVPGAKNYSVFFKPLARGGLLPGFGGGDQVPAMLEAGEAVIDKHRTRMLAPLFKRLGVPGFASGGLAGAQNAIAGAGAIDTAAGARVDVNALVKAIKAAIAARAAQLNPFAGITGVPSGGKISGSAAAAQAFARSILWAYGWGQNQFPPLQALWSGESGWRWNALNPSSGAYGIPQALPASKMASAGADWRTNPATQIRWGLGYIKNTRGYGSPAVTYAKWLSRFPHWYADGGLVPGMATGMATGGKVPPKLAFGPWLSRLKAAQAHEQFDWAGLWWAFLKGPRKYLTKPVLTGLRALEKKEYAEQLAYSDLIRHSSGSAANLDTMGARISLLGSRARAEAGAIQPALLGHRGGHPGWVKALTAQLKAITSLTGRQPFNPPWAPGSLGAVHSVLPGVLTFDNGGLWPSGTLGWNGSGMTETVTPGGAGTGPVTVVVQNHGVIGSQGEVRTWLTREINNLARTGYLTNAVKRAQGR